MSSKATSIIIGLIVIIVVGSVVYMTKQSVYERPYTQIPIQNAMNIENIESTEVIKSIKNTENATGNTVANPAQKNKTSSTPQQIDVAVTPEKQSQSAKSGITLAEVADHGTRTSCWSVVDGDVYDLTGWIPNHPGGERRILGMCGIDASAAFNRQHGGSRRIAKILAGFKIDTLTQ